MNEKIIIFPGAFNPPHNTHFNMAYACLQNITDIDKLIFVPVGDMYNKNHLEKSFHRYNMLNLICNENPKLDVSDVEIKNKRQLFTYETLDFFAEEYKDKNIYLLIGTDNLKEFDIWRMYEYILKKYKIIVVNRGCDDTYEIIRNNQNLNKYIDSFIVLDNIKSDLSSTKIRETLKKSVNDILQDLPLCIQKYIIENKLYL